MFIRKICIFSFLIIFATYGIETSFAGFFDHSTTRSAALKKWMDDSNAVSTAITRAKKAYMPDDEDSNLTANDIVESEVDINISKDRDGKNQYVKGTTIPYLEYYFVGSRGGDDEYLYEWREDGPHLYSEEETSISDPHFNGCRLNESTGEIEEVHYTYPESSRTEINNKYLKRSRWKCFVFKLKVALWKKKI